MKYSILIIFLIFISCTQKEEVVTDKNLLGFKSTFLAEFGDDKFDGLRSKTDDKPVVKYIDDVIFVTLYKQMNACDRYNGTVVVKNDSIILGCKSLIDEACTSTVIDKLSYIIDNPGKKKYKVEFRN